MTEQALTATIPLDRAKVFYDGVKNEPRVNHPEGIAVHPDGSVWCGTGTGDVLRIDPSGERAEHIASTGGFVLGLDFDPEANLFLCDMKHCQIFRLDARTRKLAQFGAGLRIPNVPLVDAARGVLYVSDSYAYGEPGPGIYRFDLASGRGGLWYEGALSFANGLALSPDGASLFVAESGGRRVRRIPIRGDGSAGAAEAWVEHAPRIPDGLGWDAHDNLLIASYEPSRLYRVRADRSLELLIDDPDAQVLAHPANVARRGQQLFTSNLGRWHITVIDSTGY
jgi:sugar lactone lactonase YvrE